MANSRCDVDRETLALMKKAGCYSLCIGIESGSQTVLDEMRKGLKLDQVRRFVADCHEAGILLHGCFLLGGPGETRETMEQSLAFAKELPLDTAQFFPLMVYPGTEAYEWAKEKGYLATEDFSEWLTPDGLHNCLLSRPELSAAQVVDFSDKARRSFYLRPRFVVYKAKQVLSDFGELFRLVRAARTFYRYLWRGSFGRKVS
jgi:radical SAM superfamily enzyme YgiQ (UPF0313 family)